MKGGGWDDQIFTLGFIIDKCWSCQTALVLIIIGYEQAFDSADRKALSKSYPCKVCKVYK